MHTPITPILQLSAYNAFNSHTFVYRAVLYYKSCLMRAIHYYSSKCILSVTLLVWPHSSRMCSVPCQKNKKQKKQQRLDY